MVMPYKRYSTQAVEELLSGTTSVPIPVACENSTMRRIRIWFFLLRSYFKSCLQSLKQLFQTDLSKSKLTPTNFYKIVLEQLGIHAGRSSAIAKQQLHEQLAVMKAVHDVSIQSELDHYNRAYTGQYVQCQLTYAGATSELFTEKAIDQIYEYSSGIARMIDKICTSVLIYGSQNRMRLIDDHAVAKVLEGEFS